jgi:chemotaxis regulatin CheY-phosphate phosphatase CheZ
MVGRKNNDNFNPRWPFIFNAIIESLDLRELVCEEDSLLGQVVGQSQLLKNWIEFLLVWNRKKNIPLFLLGL